MTGMAGMAARIPRFPRQGWAVIAGKEFADHLLSARFVVLVLIVGLAVIVPLYLAANRIRELASDVSGAQAVFIALFTLGPEDPNLSGILRVVTFVAIVAPLLGVAFSFDAVNGERAAGTLPRLLSQPIHRDDVINGKFVAGIAVISLVLVMIVGLISGIGILRLGIVPTVSEALRLICWVLVTIVYVGFWLAFGLLLSVAVRSAATSALIGFGVWFLLTIFGGLIVSLVAGVLAPVSGSAEEQLSALGAQQMISRLLPTTLYNEVALVLLNPSVTTVSVPSTVGQFTQAQQQLPTLLSLDQSLLVVWPQVVVLIALTVICFAAAYILFMRQEVRA
jgi:ABC-2 type transport system permease protein